MQTHDFRSFVAAVSQLVFRQQTGVATVCISNASAFLNSAHLSYENRQQKHQSDIQTDFGLGEYCGPWQNLGFHRMSVKNLMRVVPPRGDSTIVGHRQITPLISSPFSFVISLISFIMFRLTHLYFSMCFSSLSFLRVVSRPHGGLAMSLYLLSSCCFTCRSVLQGDSLALAWMNAFHSSLLRPSSHSSHLVDNSLNMLVTFKMSYSWKYVVLDGGKRVGQKAFLLFSLLWLTHRVKSLSFLKTSHSPWCHSEAASVIFYTF